MMETPSSGHPLIDVVLWHWFALIVLAVAYVAYHQFKGGPEEKSLAMKTMRWGWVLLTLYTGPFGFIVYWFLHRAPARETPEQSQPSLWEQSVESTIHCVAGDATGILIAVVGMSWLRLPMGVELIAEYVAGFAVGLLLFQALCMKSTFDGSYRRAVRGTFLPETLSMNAVMAGMIPVMIILMSRDMSAMEPTSVRFWGTMSLAVVVSTVTTFPVNWWLVARGLKHGMGGEERARLRHAVSAASKLTAVVLTLAMLAVGIIFAARYGDFSMRARAAYVTGTTLLIDGGITLLDFTADALAKDSSLPQFAGRVSDSGEGGWTIKAVVDEGVPVPVLTTALYARFASRGEADFQGKLLSAMRYGFGGHLEKSAK